MSHKLFSKVDHILRLNNLDKRQVVTLKELYEEIVSKINSLKDEKAVSFSTEEANSVRQDLSKEEKHYLNVKHQMDEYFKKHAIDV